MTDRILPGDPPWLIAAFHDEGVHEIDGPNSSPRVIEMYRAAGCAHPENLDDSTTPWCSAAMSAWFVESGLRGTGSLAGRSWDKRGRKLDARKKLPRGALLILRYDNNPNHGHICILLSDDGERLREIGGNQSNKVSISSWPRDRLIAAVWPDDYPMPNVVPLPRPKPKPETEEGDPQMPPDVPAPSPQPRPDDPGPEPAPPAQPSLLRRIGNWIGGLFASGGLFYAHWALFVAVALLIVAGVGLLLYLYGKEPIKAWISRHLGMV